MKRILSNRLSELESEDRWRIPLIQKLLKQRSEAYYMVNNEEVE